MDSIENTVILENVLERTLNFIAKAESKIPPVLVIDTSMLGVLVAVIPKYSQWSNFSVLMVFLAILPLFVSLIMLFIAQFPRIKGPKGSLLFFRGITSFNLEEYTKNIKSLDGEGYFNDLIKQTYRNAEIASSKYRWIRCSLISLFVSIIPWIIVIFNFYRGEK